MGYRAINLTPNDANFSEYKEEILAILEDRYKKQLGYSTVMPDDLQEFLIKNYITKITITVDDLTNSVCAVSLLQDKGYNASKVKGFALKSQALSEFSGKQLPAALFHLSSLFNNNSVFFEITETLFKILMSYFVRRKIKSPIYVYPAEAVARILPKRKMLVSDDGVFYEKFVHGAHKTVKKIFIANVEAINGVRGYEGFKEAKRNSKYNGGLIIGLNGGQIRELDFDPAKWGKFGGKAVKLMAASEMFYDYIVKYAVPKYQQEYLSGKISEEDRENIKKEHSAMSILKNFIDTPDIFIHFSDIERASFNPKYNYDTPFGIYAYPLTTELYSKISQFGLDREYIHIYRFFGNKLDTDSYTKQNLQTDIQSLLLNYRLQDLTQQKTEEYIREAKNNSPIMQMWNITRMSAKQNAFAWSEILKDILEYDYVFDKLGVIHSNEPYQAVCLISRKTGKANYQHITTIKNDLQALSFVLFELNKKINPEISISENRNKNLPIPMKYLTGKDQLEAVKQNGYAIQHINNPSEAVQLEAVKQYGFAIQYINNPSEAVQLEAVKQYGYAIRHIKNPSEALQLEAVKQSGLAIYYINNPSEAVQLEAVKQSGLAIEHIKNPSEAVQLAAVKQYGHVIQHIKNPSEAVQLEAVKQNGFAIQCIKNPSEAVQLEAVKQNGLAIQHIKNPSEVVQLEAVKQCGLAIQHIKNPSEAVQLKPMAK